MRIASHTRAIHIVAKTHFLHKPKTSSCGYRHYSAMATNGSTNGAAATNGQTNGQTNGSSKFDPNFTQHVIDLMSPETTPRNRVILSSLIRHMHDFCREVELTQEEWITGVNYVNAIGQAYKTNRNEAWRVCDILGIES